MQCQARMNTNKSFVKKWRYLFDNWLHQMALWTPLRFAFGGANCDMFGAQCRHAGHWRYVPAWAGKRLGVHGIYKLAIPAEKTSMEYVFTCFYIFYVFSKGDQVKIKLTNLKFSTNASLDMFFNYWLGEFGNRKKGLPHAFLIIYLFIMLHSNFVCLHQFM